MKALYDLSEKLESTTDTFKLPPLTRENAVFITPDRTKEIFDAKGTLDDALNG